MIETHETKSEKYGIMRMILRYFNKNPLQAKAIVLSLSIGFVIAVFFVSYAVLIQAKHGCLTFFMQK